MLEYVIIEPAARQLKHYRLQAPGQYAEPHIYGETDNVRFICLLTISFTVGQRFEGAPDTTL